jgi:hypothetical protein
MATQRELFPGDTKRWAADFILTLSKRLEGAEFRRPSEIAGACNVSVTMVYAWIQEGRIVAVDVSSKDKAYWQILAASVVGMYSKRLGLDDGDVDDEKEQSTKKGKRK